jgi:acyl-CoA reductase-like NAD-dependent aldehyde dehydrogenase
MATEVQQVCNWINGKYEADPEGRTLDDLAPATGELIAKIPRTQALTVDRAVQAAVVSC